MEHYKAEAEKTLNSLEGMSKAEMHPYFYDKVMHKLRNENVRMKRPAFRWAAIAGAVVIMYFFTGLYYYKTSEVNQTSASQDFAAEYFNNDYQYQSL